MIRESKCPDFSNMRLKNRGDCDIIVVVRICVFSADTKIHRRIEIIVMGAEL